MQKLHCHEMFTNSHYYTTLSPKSMQSTTTNTAHILFQHESSSILIQDYNLDRVYTFSFNKHIIRD